MVTCGTSAFNVYLNMNEFYQQQDEDEEDNENKENDLLTKIQTELNGDFEKIYVILRIFKWKITLKIYNIKVLVILKMMDMTSIFK